LQWKDTQAGQLMDSKLKCVFELPAGNEVQQVTRDVVELCSTILYWFFCVFHGYLFVVNVAGLLPSVT